MGDKKREETTDVKRMPAVGTDPDDEPQLGKEKKIVSPDPSKVKEGVWNEDEEELRKPHNK